MSTRRARRIQACALAALLGGPLAALAGWGAYLHSPIYRRSVEADLHDVFGLPARVGRVECLDLLRRRFYDVRILLPDGREAFRCDWADLIEHRSTPQERYELLVQGATFLIDERDNVYYAAAGKRDYASLGVSRVELRGSSLDARQGGMGIAVHQADGWITWLDRKRRLAQVSVRAQRVNGAPAGEPVEASATFTAEKGVHIHGLQVTVPSLPVSAVATQGLLGSAATTGTFQGRLEVAFGPAGTEVTVLGRLLGADLSEWTRRLPPRRIRPDTPETSPASAAAFAPSRPAATAGLRGSADVVLDRAVVLAGRLQTLQGRVTLRDLQLDSLGALLGETDFAGKADLRVTRLDVTAGRLLSLQASGAFAGLGLQPLARLAELGGVTGKCDGVLADLTVEDGRLTSFRLLATEDATAPRQVSNELVARLFGQILHLPLPEKLLAAVPGRWSYEGFNLEVLLRDGLLHVGGQVDTARSTSRVADGDPAGQRRPIAVLRVMGMPVAIQGDFDHPLDVREKLSRLETRMEELLSHASPGP